MIKRWVSLVSLILSLLLLSGFAWADASCEESIHQLEYKRFLGHNAQCAGNKQDFCVHLETMDLAEYEKLLAKLKKEGDQSIPQHGEMKTIDAFAACGLDFDTLHYRQCQKAYRRENLDFILTYCPGEAWSLARAQCERQPETVSRRYERFCDMFYNGKAPGPGERASEY